MKKIFGILIVAMALTLCGCGQEQKTNEVVNNTSCKEIMEEVLDKVEGMKTDSTLFYDDGQYEEYFEFLYDTSYDRAADGAYAYASASYADEISIILADEEKDVDVIKGHLEERIERRARDFEGYEPDEADKVYNAVIDTNGLYVIMVIADDAENIVDDINDVIEEVK